MDKLEWTSRLVREINRSVRMRLGTRQLTALRLALSKYLI